MCVYGRLGRLDLGRTDGLKDREAGDGDGAERSAPRTATVTKEHRL